MYRFCQGLVCAVVLLALFGCSQPAPSPAPEPTAAPAAVLQQAAQAATHDVAAPATSTPTPSLAPTPAVTATPDAAATLALSPTPAQLTATPAATTTSQVETVFVVITGDTVNLRGGPGVGFAVVGQAARGQRYPVQGRNAAGDWWQIDADGQTVWVSAGLASIEGDAAALPAIAPPTPPVQPAITPTAPAARPAAPVQVYEVQLTIPTYPYAAFTTEAFDPAFNWTYRRFDRTAYEASNPLPSPKTYRAVVLENEYLKLTLLPELGGRIYQVIFKPTGSNQLYQNPVIKPSPWGPAEQGGWLAAGGIEWGLPVAEHGYAWGDRWGHITFTDGPDAAGVTVFMPAGEHLRADVDVILRAGEAAFTIQPRIVNPTNQPVAYQFWIDAMLAPGPANRPGPNLRLLLPTDQVTVHSRGDESLPTAGQAMSWPIYNGVDYSRLGNWNRWLSVFERPAAHGPFAGVYDEDANEGIVRVFAPAATPGSKLFAPGWAEPFDPSLYTDDNSAYVELHAGVTPTFWDQATLAAGATYTWQETWFPVAGIGGVSYADANGAVRVARLGDTLAVGLFPLRAVTGKLTVTIDGETALDELVTISPAQPFRRDLAGVAAPGQRVNVQLLDQSGAPVINYGQRL